MSSINKAIIIGRLGQAPELKNTPNGVAVCSFSMATSEKFKDKQGQQQEQTEWHNIVAWNRSAEVLAQYLQKGSLVYIEGKLKTDNYEKDGQKHYSTKIVVSQFQFLDNKTQNSQQPVQNNGFQQQQQGFQQLPIQNGNSF